MASAFSAADLARLREEREVRIETRRDADAQVHRTVIWVVVDPRDRVLIRSYRGASARWYREALAHPEVRVQLDGRAIEARAVPATDHDRVESCSDGFLHKYTGDPAARAMVAPELLDTTLELVPR